MPRKLDIAKTAVNFVTGAGVTKIVNDIIKNNVTPETTAETVQVYAGSVVLGSMVVSQSSEYTNAKLDEIAGWFADRKAAKTDS